MSEHREPHPDRLSPRREPPQPAAHRRRGHPQPLGGTPMTVTTSLGHQRRADHPHLVAPSDQRILRNQHMRTSAHRTSATTRLPPHLHRLSATQHPPSSRPPRPHAARTIRAVELASNQPTLDFERIDTYDDHQCLRAPKGPSRSLPGESTGGSLRDQSHRHHPNHPHHTCHQPAPPSSTNLALYTPVHESAHRATRPSTAAARAFGRVAAGLRAAGRKPKDRAYDALIASVAVATGLPLYTVNPDDFANIADLDLRTVPHPDVSSGPR